MTRRRLIATLGSGGYASITASPIQFVLRVGCMEAYPARVSLRRPVAQ